MKNCLVRSTLFAVFAALTPVGFTAELGGLAPALQAAEWVKGRPVDLAAGEGRNVFVVEFRATWCAGETKAAGK